MGGIIFALVVLGLAGLIFKASRRPSPTRTVQDYKRKFVRPIVLTLGSDPSLQETAAQDGEVYRKDFPEIKTLSIANSDLLREALAGQEYDIAHIINRFDESGQVVWGDGHTSAVSELIRMCVESGVSFVFLAFGLTGEKQQRMKEILDAGRSVRIAYYDLGIILDRGPEFAAFLQKLVKDLRAGEPPMLAWLRVRPQDAGGPQPLVDHGPDGVVSGYKPIEAGAAG